MTGPATLADHVIPTITAAARAAGRAAPMIGAGFVPVVFGIVILYLLFNQRAHDYFAKD